MTSYASLRLYKCPHAHLQNISAHLWLNDHCGHVQCWGGSVSPIGDVQSQSNHSSRASSITQSATSHLPPLAALRTQASPSSKVRSSPLEARSSKLAARSLPSGSVAAATSCVSPSGGGLASLLGLRLSPTRSHTQLPLSCTYASREPPLNSVQPRVPIVHLRVKLTLMSSTSPNPQNGARGHRPTHQRSTRSPHSPCSPPLSDDFVRDANSIASVW